ncbi:MAG: hypothetical protein R3E79_01950 [Caldilineaceae bacterium]
MAIDAVGAMATDHNVPSGDAGRQGRIFIGLHDEQTSRPTCSSAVRSPFRALRLRHTPLDFEDAFDWLAEGRIEIDPWLQKSPLAEGGACFEQLLGKPGLVAKS